MKTNDILNKVTLEFIGGGELELSEYTPYISNGETNIEGLGSKINPFKESKYEPVAYLMLNAYKDEAAMWIYQAGLGNSVIYRNSLYEPKVFTLNELREYFNLMNKVFGYYNWDYYNWNSIYLLYSTNNIPNNEYLAIGLSNSDEDEWNYGFTNKPALVTERTLESWGYSDKEIDLFNNQVTKKGLYMYDDYYNVNNESDPRANEPEIDESKIDTYIQEYGVKVYINNISGSNNLYFTDIETGNSLNDIYTNNYYEDSNGDRWILAPLGTYYIQFSNTGHILHDDNNGATYSGTNQTTWTFEKGGNYWIEDGAAQL